MWSKITIGATVVMLFAAYLGFKNHEALQQEQAEKALAQGDLDLVNSEIKEHETRFKEAKSKRDEQEAVLAQKTEELDKLLSEVKDMESSNAQLQLSTQNKELEEMKAKFAEFAGMDEVIEEIKSIDAENAQLQTKKGDLDSTLQGLVAREKVIAKQVESANQRISDRAAKIAPADLKATVGSAHQDFGFVTVNAGVNQGVVQGCKLAVMRHGEKIADLVIQTVEANRSTADVVRDSLPAGEQVRSGDSVIAVRPEGK